MGSILFFHCCFVQVNLFDIRSRGVRIHIPFNLITILVVAFRIQIIILIQLCKCFHKEDLNNAGGLASAGCSQLDLNAAIFNKIQGCMLRKCSLPYLDIFSGGAGNNSQSLDIVQPKS